MVYETINTELKGLFESSWDSHGMLVLETRREDLVPLVTRLKNELGFNVFLDVTAIDYPEREPRFTVVYHFLSTTQKTRIRLKLQVSESDPTVPTLTGLYNSSRFMERECHEMYGIKFTGNNDLRPILLYEGFVGHPLRKDYPIDQEQPLVDYRK
ncbi:NADH-quinone oxidoreductase subunit C [Geomonas sp. RF6]|uniref:NADH-quinone oxidoreductase subunit C n=1 Tax=Geomonas sp. RF6 TaxID=2897342 RepID=UPI001E3F920A|nr:NADH-quinone oxidoreductase subunit C [Geomonas sp. RF6]UFS72572.1 NADH-quinone oxidoreductase subunit C [Geomonas sp. RF6]